MDNENLSKQLKKRRVQMMERINNLPELEELYFLMAHDIGFLNETRIELLYPVKQIKTELKGTCKTIAEFNREFKLRDEAIQLKAYKYQITSFEKMMAGCRVRVESLKAEVRGSY